MGVGEAGGGGGRLQALCEVCLHQRRGILEQDPAQAPQPQSSGSLARTARLKAAPPPPRQRPVKTLHTCECVTTLHTQECGVPTGWNTSFLRGGKEMVAFALHNSIEQKKVCEATSAVPSVNQ